MNSKAFFLWLVILVAASAAWAQGTRKPIVAGAFYDADPKELAAQIDGYLSNVSKLPKLDTDVLALVVPHAGYVFSAPTAAYAYRLVQGKPIETVIVIGTSHQYPLDGCSIYLQGGFETPLGVVPVDEETARQLAQASGFSYVAGAHEKEHSVEVQIPFIQRVLPQAKIVPVVMGFPSRRTILSLANGLAAAGSTKKILIVASTDLSHYLSKGEANEVDAETISLVRNLNTETLINKLAQGENIMCGGGPVVATLLSLKKKGSPRVEVLNYSDSSAANDDPSRVVGYLAAAVTLESKPREFSLSAEEKKELLELARRSITQFVEEKTAPDYKTENPNFLTEKGAFVTIKKRGLLRGCIGFIEPVLPLYQTIIQASVFAATRDPRFRPVSSEELKDLELEISVLTPLQKIDNPQTVQVGKHGLVISMGENRGLLLPQVPVENNWSRETFLQEACLKAGLPSNAWKKGAEIFIFEAIVFH